MGLNSAGLDAFFICAQEKNFTRAAKRLFVTQSALSQRIKNLEEEMGSSLFIRERIGVKLTEAGESLLRYCFLREQMEQDLLTKGELSGSIKIGAYSTVARSVILPAIQDIAKKNPQIQIQLQTKEMHELPELLRNSSFQFIVLDYKLEVEGINSIKLGIEQNIRVRKKDSKFTGYFIDNDQDDETTLRYLKLKSGAKIKRHYLDEVYALIDGVLLGLGDAILPKHLVENVKGLEFVDKHLTLSNSVYLHFYHQAVQPRLETLVIEALQTKVPEFLRTQ